VFEHGFVKTADHLASSFSRSKWTLHRSLVGTPKRQRVPWN